MAVDEQTVAQIAQLARIRLEPEQKRALAEEMGNIIHWVEQLNELDTEGVEPMTSVAEMALKMRDDVVADGDRQADILKNAPETRHGYFVVPKVVD
ncbi:aspartyl/glutamyl-tRNA(Asn/Gln) amidotransferase subunit C [Limimonas halophila]|uniref:Aspartyl/glutamyl-tRNA(Asn/Gln) amidotransferase subunit C n=1 Tax=Limimonas halophila TaxID=1082479 RepID=A0A1G7P5F1_9PROT|nr:Asp-tRNA(Asn)/Glu-tRNA(Gln) amidotransferase subunit GatC [Limimonas halophila]SDF81451.1 aspartyl/glutamyl-tRNA(Asn/Gln) amidotransferase subunit C [Limimonas halophila]